MGINGTAFISSGNQFNVLGATANDANSARSLLSKSANPPNVNQRLYKDSLNVSISKFEFCVSRGKVLTRIEKYF